MKCLIYQNLIHLAGRMVKDVLSVHLLTVTVVSWRKSYVILCKLNCQKTKPGYFIPATGLV